MNLSIMEKIQYCFCVQQKRDRSRAEPSLSIVSHIWLTVSYDYRTVITIKHRQAETTTCKGIIFDWTHNM